MAVSLLLLSPGVVDFRSSAAMAADEPSAFSLAYVPRDVLAVVALRPQVLLQRPAVKPFAEAIREMVVDSFASPVEPSDVAEVTVFVLPSGDTGASFAMKLRLGAAEGAERIVAEFQRSSQPIPFADATYLRSPSLGCAYRVDETTVIVAQNDATIRRCLIAGAEGASPAKWSDRWASVAARDGAALVNTSLTRPYSPQQIIYALREIISDRNLLEQMQPTIYRLTPIWARSDTLMVELLVTDELGVRVITDSCSVEEATLVHSALRTLIACGRLGLSFAREGAVASANAGDILARQVELFDRLLENAVIARTESQVTVWVEIDKQATQAITAMAVPATVAARSMRNQNASAENLKKIGLAFQNYHDTYGRFPVPAKVGSNGVSHSWRVALLPFFLESELYEEYRQDEPWDSEHNLKLLQKMPDVYRCPLDRRDSTNTSYFVLDGPSTALHSEGGDGSSMARITDGTSNTILAVESKRSVPWTKPEDIPFDPDQPLPEIGGWYPTGFATVFCDGSWRVLPASLDEQTLRHLIMRSDGKRISLPRR